MSDAGTVDPVAERGPPCTPTPRRQRPRAGLAAREQGTAAAERLKQRSRLSAKDVRHACPRSPRHHCSRCSIEPLRASAGTQSPTATTLSGTRSMACSRRSATSSATDARRLLSGRQSPSWSTELSVGPTPTWTMRPAPASWRIWRAETIRSIHSFEARPLPTGDGGATVSDSTHEPA